MTKLKWRVSCFVVIYEANKESIFLFSSLNPDGQNVDYYYY